MSKQQDKIFIAPIWVDPPEFKEAINELAEMWGVNIATLVRLLLIKAIVSEKIVERSETKSWKK